MSLAQKELTVSSVASPFESAAIREEVVTVCGDHQNGDKKVMHWAFAGTSKFPCRELF